MTDNKKYIISVGDQSEIWDSDMFTEKGDALFAKYSDADVFEMEDAEGFDEDPTNHQYIINVGDQSEVWDADMVREKGSRLMEAYPDVKIQRLTYKDYWGEQAEANRAKRAELLKPNEERNAKLAEIGYYDDITGGQVDFSLDAPSTIGLKPLSSALEESLAGETVYHDPRVKEFFANDTAETDRQAEIARLDAEYDANPSVIAQREWEAKMLEERKAYAGKLEQQILKDKKEDVDEYHAGQGAAAKHAQDPSGANQVTQAIRMIKGEDVSKDLVELQKQERYDSALKFLQKAKIARDVAGKGFWGATIDWTKEGVMDAGTQSDIETYNEIGDILTRLEKELGNLKEENFTEEVFDKYLSKDEQALIKSFYEYNAAMADAQQDMSRAYKGGKIFAESVPFMLEFLATGGAYKAAGRAATSWMGKHFAKWIAKSASKKVAKAATKAISGAVKAAIGTAARTVATPGTYKRMAEASIEIDKDGHLHRAKNAAVAFADMYVENLSEISGDLIGELGKGARWLLGKTPLSKIGGLLGDNMFMQTVSKGMKSFMPKLKALGFNGLPEEIGEEFIGNTIRDITNIQPGALKEMFEDDNFGAMLIGFAPMTMIGVAGGAVSLGVVNAKAAKIGKDLREKLGSAYTEEELDHMMGVIQNAQTAEEIQKALKPMAMAAVNSFEKGVITKEQMTEQIEMLYQYGGFMAQNNALLFGKKAQDKQMMDAKREEFTTQLGRFWQEDQTETVQVATLNNGSTVFVTSAPAEDGKIAIVDAVTGKKGFANVSDIATREVDGEQIQSSNSMTMDAFLNGQIAMQRKTAEETRMNNERNAQIEAIAAQITPGTRINLGTEGSPVIVYARGTNKRGVVIVDETGMESTLGWEQAAYALGQPIKVETDQQKLDAEISERLQRMTERRMRRAVTPATEATAEAADEAAEVVAQEQQNIPLREDGTVDEALFWTQDPEGYVKWNDEQNKDGGQDSLKQIAISKQELFGMLNEAAAGQNTSNPTMRKAAEKQVAAIAEKIARLEALEMSYADALAEEKEAVKQTQATPTATMSEEQLEQMDAQYQGILGKTRIQSERVRVMQEYLDKLAEDSVPVVLLTMQNYEERMKADGVPNSLINAVKKQVDAGKTVAGFMAAGKVYLMHEGLTSIEDGRVTYVHERQHAFNRANPQLVQRVADALGNEDAALAILKTFVNEKALETYKDDDLNALADEIICRSMEIVYSNEEFSVDLQSKGVPSEVISIITEIDNEQRQDQSLSYARRRGRRNSYSDVSGAGSVRQDGRDIEQISEGVLEQEETRPSGSSGGGAQTGEGAEVISDDDDASFRIVSEPEDPNGVTAEQNDEINRSVGGELEIGDENASIRFSVTAIGHGAGLELLKDDGEGNVALVLPDGRKFNANNLLKPEDLKSLPDSVLSYMMSDARALGNIDARKEWMLWNKYTLMLNAILSKGSAENGGFEHLASQWQWIADTVYKTVATNSDTQYSYSLDITRVCKKNEAVINAIAEMQARLGYGITPGQIMDIYMSTIEEGYQVPCPVCYVFSRYIRNGKYATIMINGQRKYGSKLIDPRTLSEEEKEKLIKYWLKELKKIQDQNEANENEINKANSDITVLLDEIDKLSKQITDPRSNLTEEQKETVLKKIHELDARYKAALNVVSQSSLDSWITQFAIYKKKEDGKEKWMLYEDSYMGFPEEMALDLRQTSTVMRLYPAIQRFRKSRGAAAGKEITFVSNNDLGDVALALGSKNATEELATPRDMSDKEWEELQKKENGALMVGQKNLYQQAYEEKDANKKAELLKKARERFASASEYAKRQSLRGGQRMWSWSDNIERLAPDVFVNIFQMELLGGALQSYSKQLEGIKLVASMNGYVNGSLMGKGNGYAEVSEENVDEVDVKFFLKGGDFVMTLKNGKKSTLRTPVYKHTDGKFYVLEFDDVVGIDAFGKDIDGKHYKGLFELNAEYDKAGNILVGMNDLHIRIAMADDRIFFIIPWHSSGANTHILAQMYDYLGVEYDVTLSQDYTEVQSEKRIKGAGEKEESSKKDKKGKEKKESTPVSTFLAEFWNDHYEKAREYEGYGMVAGKDFACGIEGGIASSDGKGNLSEDQMHYRELRDAIFMGVKVQTGTDKKGKPTYKNVNVEEYSEQWFNEIMNDEFLSQVYARVRESMGENGRMASQDTKSIYPYEYWDESSTYETSSINGARYMEYCRRLGYKPKFCGKLDGKPETDFGNFTEDAGYWKTLIDRRMYAVDGSFQGLTPVTAENFTPDLVDPMVTKEEFVVTRVADEAGTQTIVDKAIAKEESRPGGIAKVDYDMTLSEALYVYNGGDVRMKVSAPSGAIDLVAEAERAFDGDVRMRIIGEQAAQRLDNANKATTMMDNLAVAREMEEAGKDAKAIKLATGWERAADTKWRYEQPDLVIKAKHGRQKNFQLKRLIEDSTLFTEYPILKDVKVIYEPLPMGDRGFVKYVDGKPEIHINVDAYMEQNPVILKAINDFVKRHKDIADVLGEKRDLAALSPEQKKLVMEELGKVFIANNPYTDKVGGRDILVHEIQHIIQHEEGFAQGGSDKMLDTTNPQTRAMVDYMRKEVDQLTAELYDNFNKRMDLRREASEAVKRGDKEAEQRANDERLRLHMEFNRMTKRVAFLEDRLGKVKRLGIEGYKNLAGEVEARNVASRLMDSAEERRNTLLSETEDVAREDQIFLLDNVMMKADEYMATQGVSFRITPEQDKAYMDAVNAGDMETAQRMVDAAARAAGYDSPKLYHGTQSFGFTKIDTSKSDDRMSFFATESPAIARSYSSVGGERLISSAPSKEEIKKAAQEWGEAAEEALLEYSQRLYARLNQDQEIDADEFMLDLTDGVYSIEARVEEGELSLGAAVYEIYDVFDAILNKYYSKQKYDSIQKFLDEKPAVWEERIDVARAYFDYFNKLINGGAYGNYSFYANTWGMLEVECNGSNWNDIKSGDLPDRDYSTTIMGKPWKTRGVAKYAKEEGYKGVIFKNIVDPGGRAHVDKKDRLATIYDFFDPQQQVKSADPVTYDNDGKVIPLSERFNPENADIRFRFTPRTDEQREQLFDKAKAHYGLTNNFNASGYMLPDGSLLDFSEANDGGDPNRRSLDHRDIEGLIMDEGKEYDSRYHYVVDFVDEGAIRMLPEAAGFQLSVPPTAEQRSRLMDYIYKHNGEVIMEITDENGSPRVYMEYNRRTSPSRIFSDMDRFFNEGVVPGIPPLRFRIANDNQAIFVSNAAKAVEGIKQEKATPEQWLKMIEKNGGLKAGEDKWMGLSDFLKSSDKKTLTKQEVLDFVNEHMIVIEETHYLQYAEEAAADSHREIVDRLQEKFNAYVAEYHEQNPDADEYADPAGEYAIEKLREEMEDTFPYTIEKVYGNEVYVTFDYEDMEEMEKWSEKLGVVYDPQYQINSTRLNYTTSGLNNKHEIALTVPTIESWNETDEVHFGEAGGGRAVAWIRFGETTIKNKESDEALYNQSIDELNAFWDSMREKYGNGWQEYMSEEEKLREKEIVAKYRQLRKDNYRKVLVIDEIQSKRHQEGREKGYKPKDYWPLRTKYLTTKTVYDSFYGDMEGKYGEAFSEASTEEDFRKVMSESDFSQMLRIKEDFERASNAYIPYRNSVPDAPFDKNWHELAMKRMLRYAAENGYDIIAWTKGEQQANRYNLGKIYNEIEREDNPNIEGRTFSFSGGNYDKVTVNEDGVVVDSTIEEAKGKSLSDLVGKDLAVKMMSLENYDTIDEEDLRIGGEGMKGFYDRMLPAFMNKYGKKWGVKVEDIELPNLEDGLTMHSVPVTDEMKASVLEGQVMFRTIPITQEVQDEMDAIKASAIVMGNYLKAPNGADTNLTPEQWAMVRTKAFRAWFGLWEENFLFDNLLSRGGSIMGDTVVDSIANSKILDSVIASIPVNVMNNLGGKKRATQMLLHNIPMFVDVMTLSSTDADIFTFAVSAMKVIALTRAKLSSTESTSSNGKLLSALDTLQDNLIFSLASLASTRKLTDASIVFPSTRDRAEHLIVSGLSAMFTDIHNLNNLGIKDNENIAKYQTTLKEIADAVDTVASKVIDENGEPKVVYHGSPNAFTAFDKDMIGETTDPGFYGQGFYFATTKAEAKGYGKHIIDAFVSLKNPLDLNTVYEQSNKWDGETADGAVRWWYGLASMFPEQVGDVTYASIERGDWTILELKDRVDELAKSSETPFADAMEEFEIDDSFFDWLEESDINIPEEFTSALVANGYDGVINAGAENNEIVALEPNQIKSATDNTGEFSEENDDIRFRTSLELDEEFGDAWRNQQNEDGRHSTQVANTKSTYEKIGRYLEDAGMKGASILDASSGLGLGTQALREMGFQVDDVEPFPSENREAPTFSSYADIDGKYDVVISNAVLNVIPDDWRADVLHQMAAAVKEGGKMIINTRPASNIAQQGVEGKTRITLDSPSEILVKRGDRIAAYQKGFTSEELAEWIKSELGEGWRVEKATKKNSGISGEGTAVVIKESDDTRFRTIGTPTDEVVANGLSLTPAQTAEVAANIFAALPEENRKKITDGLNGNILGLKDAILQIPASLASKENWNEEDKQMAAAVREVVQDLVDANPTTRPLTTKEALWMLYDSTSKVKDLVDAASRAFVAYNLGFDPASMQRKREVSDYLRFRTASNGAIDAATDMYNYETSLWTERLKESWLDMNQSVVSLQKAMAEASGMPIEPWENLEFALNRLSSKSYADKKKYLRDFLMPMWDAIIEIVKVDGKSIEEIERYMMLKHGLERNKKFATRDAKDFYRTMYDLVAERMKSQSHAQQVVALSEAKKKLADIDAQIAVASSSQLPRLNEARARAQYEVNVADLVLRGDEKQNETELQAYYDAIDNEADPKYREFREKDYGGLTSMFVDTTEVQRSKYKSEEAYQKAVLAATTPRYDDVAAMESAAEREVSLFEKVVGAKNLWDKVNAATKETLRHQYESGMITIEQYEAVRDMFDFYVPLRGFADNTAEDMYSYYMNNSAGGFTKPILGAKGRKTKAESPLGWIGTMAESAIQSDNKNQAKMCLYYMTLRRPDQNLLTITETWYEYTGHPDANGKKIFKAAYPPATDRALNADELRQHMEDWEDDMKKKQSRGEAYKGSQRVDLKDSVVFQDTKEEKEHIIRVKVAGKDYSILINGNPRAAQAINGLLNPDIEENAGLEAYKWLQRFVTSGLTSASHNFWLTNFQRDLLMSIPRTQLQHGGKFAARYAWNRHKAWRVFLYLFKSENKPLGNSYFEKLYKEFAENGGITGYTVLANNKEYEKFFDKYAKEAQSPQLVKFLKAIKDGWFNLGEAIEQVSRFAAYVTAKEEGQTTEEAIQAAKEVSVNFNRKGSAKSITADEIKKLRMKNGLTFQQYFDSKLGHVSPKAADAVTKAVEGLVMGLSAIPYFGRLLYFFFNAGVQSTSSLARLAKQKPGAALSWFGAYAIAGFLMYELIGALWGDDDEEVYQNLPEYERRNSILVPVGDGVYLKWALPQELRTAFGMGDAVAQRVRGLSHHKQGLDAVWDVAGELTDFLPINPLERYGLNPDLLTTLAEIRHNESGFGSPIYKEFAWKSEEEMKHYPKYRLATPKTNPIIVDVAKFLNDVTAEHEGEAGWINWNPASIEHALKGYLGGRYTTMLELYYMGRLLAGKEEFTIKNTPFAKRILLSTDEINMYSRVNEQFSFYKGVADNAKRVEKEYRESDDPSRADAYREEEDWRIYLLYKQYEQDFKDVKERLDNAVDKEEEDLLKQEQNVLREMFLDDIAKGDVPEVTFQIREDVKRFDKEIKAIMKPVTDANKERLEKRRTGDVDGMLKAIERRDSLKDTPEYQKADELNEDLKKIKQQLKDLGSVQRGSQRDSVIGELQKNYDALVRKMEQL